MTIPSFIESPRFPEDISRNSSGGPDFFNNRAVGSNGRRKVNIRRAQPLGGYDVTMGVRTQQQLDNLHAFFLNTYGGAIPFRYKDWSDYRVQPGEGFLQLIGGGKAVLVKRYRLGADHVFDRRIYKPVPGTVVLAGDLAEGDIDYTTGIVSNCFATSWTGEFDVPVAFAGDSMRSAILDIDVFDTNVQLEVVVPPGA